MQDALPEQIEAGAAVHLSFDQLQPVDLTFDHAVAPRQLQRGCHCILVSSKTSSEGCKWRLFGSLQPTWPRFRVSSSDHVEQLSCYPTKRG